MNSDHRTFTERLKAASPTPPGQSPAYEKFNGYIIFFNALIYLTLYYILMIIFSKDKISEYSFFLEKSFPAVTGRMSFLRDVDGGSHLSYTVCIFLTTLLLPFAITVNGVVYFRTAVARYGWSSVTALTPVVMSIAVAMAVFFFWFAFLYVPPSFDARLPGMSRLYLTPIFPILAAGATAVFYFFLFPFLVGLIKFVRLLGREHDGE